MLFSSNSVIEKKDIGDSVVCRGFDPEVNNFVFCQRITVLPSGSETVLWFSNETFKPFILMLSTIDIKLRNTFEKVKIYM